MSSPDPTPVLPANPKAEYEAIGGEIDAAIAATLDNGRYILGPEVAAFEAEFAAFHDACECIGTGSGTEALHLALRAAGIGPGDAVITVSHTAVATVAAIELTGATPVLVDIHPRTYNMDPEKLEALLKNWEVRTRLLGTPTPRAVIPVHLYGHPAPMPEIVSIANHHELTIIEDCAQAHGASIKGRLVGTWGDMAAFSFYPTKNLGALGDAGALITNNCKLAEQARLIREYGWAERYISSLPGMNTRLDEIQAAILRVKLPYLRRWNKARRAIAAQYDAVLSELPDDRLLPPTATEEIYHVYHQYVIRIQNRDQIKQKLADHNIITSIHYPLPVHMQPAYRDRGLTAQAALDVTEQIASEILSLPVYPYFRPADANRVVQTLTDIVGPE